MNNYQCSGVICALFISSIALGNAPMQDDERMIQRTLDQAVHNFKQKSVRTESSIEQLLVLLDVELTLVEYLQTDETGMKVEDAVTEREYLLATSVPSVIHLYNAIMDFATYNPLLTESTTYLNSAERSAYFKRIEHVLDHYYAEFQ